MLNKEHITRGEATVRHEASVFVGNACIANLSNHEATSVREHKANAAFIAEAFNGFNLTGKTYGELVEEIEGLKKQLLNK